MELFDRPETGKNLPPASPKVGKDLFMDDLLKFLHARYEADNHAYADVAYRFGADALLDSHLPMLDLVDMPARDYEAMDPSEARFAGLGHALRVLAQSYAEHPDYREGWRP
ncbi:DUF6221 family protein [Streptomyces hirsutus]|uniref:DUF6221 family protein n=1 Tax=Streptomyces hirsutus TaxID=35620 RepID=UPI00147064C0|nr:DUF6221 family protein [Streptomyces hirsutus]